MVALAKEIKKAVKAIKDDLLAQPENIALHENFYAVDVLDADEDVFATYILTIANHYAVDVLARHAKAPKAKICDDLMVSVFSQFFPKKVGTLQTAGYIIDYKYIGKKQILMYRILFDTKLTGTTSQVSDYSLWVPASSLSLEV